LTATDISVVMAAFNEEATIAYAIESILHQSKPEFEFLIVDDCSSDNTPHVIKYYEEKDKRIRVFTNDNNLGLAASLNRAINHTKTSFIARMDADDSSLPKRLELQFKFLQEHPDVAVVGSNALLVEELGTVLNWSNMPLASDDIKKTIIKKCPLVHSSVMFRKSFIRNLGGYDEKLRKKQDYDLWFRGINDYLYANIDTPLIMYRVERYKPFKTDLYGVYVRVINAVRQRRILSGFFWAFVTFMTCLAKRLGYRSRLHRKKY